MVVAWLLFPLVLLAVCLGCGLPVERVAGWRLAGGPLLSVGLALVIVAATLTSSREATTRFTTAGVVILALAGYASGWRRLLSLRPDRWTLAVGLGVFACCAAPVVASGNATFLGYFVLNDAAVHFSLLDQYLSHARDLSALPASSYAAVLQSYVSTSYPLGADLAAGAVRPLVGQDIAWVFQPYLAVVLSLGGVAIYELLGDAVRARPLRAACAFIAAQSGLVFAYYLEASIKELATTWIVTVTVVLVVATLRQPLALRRLAPLLVVVVAAYDVLEVVIVPWIGIPLAVFVVTAAWRARHAVRGMARRRLALTVAGAAAVLAALGAPLISRAHTFFNVASSVLTKKGDLGNLAGPLQKWQLLGIWPSGDFRFPVQTHYRFTYALIGVAIASALLGALWMIRRRVFAPLLLFVSGGIATLYLLSRASPYAGAKVMMIFSIAVVLTAMLGAAALHDAGRRIEGWLLAIVIGGGVLWTNALAYHDASVAPRARFTELADIGSRFSGQGPTFYNQSDEFAVHFLRTEAPTDSALFAIITRRPGLPARAPDQFRLPWDPDDLDFSYLQSYPLLVLGRSPRTSRPPANYRLVFRGRYYDVWKRSPTPTVLAHIPLGGGAYPEAVPSCRLVMSTAARAAREHAQIAYVARPRPPSLVPTEGRYPPNWGLVAGDPYDLIPRQQSGSLVGTISVPAAGTYQVWLQASLSQRFQVWVGGHPVGSVAYQLGPQGQFVRVGQVSLAAGDQPVRIVRPHANLSPGDDTPSQFLGPLMLAGAPDPPPVSEIAPSGARALCGRSLDWIEVVR